jgi:hypothetical protein
MNIDADLEGIFGLARRHIQAINNYNASDFEMFHTKYTDTQQISHEENSS